jgi:D-alanyl-D-alanine dipeptidase
VTKLFGVRIQLGMIAALLLITPTAHGQGSNAPSGFIALRSVDPTIRQDMRYAGRDNFTGHALPGYNAPECFLRNPVAKALKEVQADIVRQNLSLKVYDCYRPARAVKGMMQWALEKETIPDTSRFYPKIPKRELFARGFIATHSAHSRGVAVDLTLVPRNASPESSYDAKKRYGSCAGQVDARAPDDSLDMGTGYDCFDVRSYTASNLIAPKQNAWRQVLLQAMARHGFKNYKREWWHFSYPSADTRTPYDFPIER